MDWEEEIKKYPYKLEDIPAGSTEPSPKSRGKPSKEWIESVDICKKCLGKIQWKVPGDLMDSPDEKKDFGLDNLESGAS